MNHQHRNVARVDSGDPRGLTEVFWLNFGQLDARLGTQALQTMVIEDFGYFDMIELGELLGHFALLFNVSAGLDLSLNPL